MPIKITCQVCGKIGIFPPSYTDRKYCSAKCYGISQHKEPVKCSNDECNRYAVTRGFCDKHYLAYRRKINPVKTNYYIKKPKKAIKKCICNYCKKEFIPKTENSKYCDRACYAINKKKPFIIKKGYKKILLYAHHRADGKGYVFEHIIIAEQTLNRRLYTNEVCHHIDGNKLNNHPNNIRVFSNNSEHIRFHGCLSK